MVISLLRTSDVTQDDFKHNMKEYKYMCVDFFFNTGCGNNQLKILITLQD